MSDTPVNKSSFFDGRNVDLSKFSSDELFKLFQLLLAPPLAVEHITPEGLDNWRTSMVGLIDTLVQRYKEQALTGDSDL